MKTVMLRLRSSEAAPAVLCGGAALAAYLLCLCPTVGPGDSGELVACALTLGICHPPGYPLLTLLGRLATLAPVSPALACNLLAATMGAAAVAFFFLALRRSGASVTGALSGALCLGLGRTVWSSSVAYEVYTTGLLLMTAVLWAGLADTDRSRMLATFAFGLALAFQPTALLWVPALVLLCWPARGGTPWGRGVTGAASFVLLLGLSVSLVTLVRARAGPELNWGDPSTPGRFVSHVWAAQYRELAAADGVLPGRSRLALLAGVVNTEAGPVALALALAGAAALALRRRRLLVALGLLGATGGFGLVYNVPDFRSYLLPAWVALAALAAWGVTAVEQRLAGPGAWRRAVVLAVAAVAPAYLLAQNLATLRGARTTLVHDLGWNLLVSLPRDAVFVTGSDVSANAVRYLQYAERLRPDVLVVQAEMLFSPTYRAALARTSALAGLNARPPVVGATRAEQVLALVNEVAARAIGSRPVCLGTELTGEAFFASPMAQEYALLPSGAVARLARAGEMVMVDSVALSEECTWPGLRLESARRDYRLGGLVGFALLYAERLNYAAGFLAQLGRPRAAVAALDRALGLPLAPAVRSGLEANREKVRAGLD